jgi:hypothetical protein
MEMKILRLMSTSWGDFKECAPELASAGKHRISGRIAYLATIKVDGSPRLHPVRPYIGDGHLYIFIDRTSPKGNDLRRDGRYALHCGMHETNGLSGEFLVSGQAGEVTDIKMRQKSFLITGHVVPDSYILFEFFIDRVLSVNYDRDRKPIRRSWNSQDGER